MEKPILKFLFGQETSSAGGVEFICRDQTGRSLKHRINEHVLSFNLKKLDSNYANHLIAENYIANKNCETIHIVRKERLLNRLEFGAIISHK